MAFFKQHDWQRGLTLIEMLTVLFLVSILVAFVTGIARHASHAANTRRAQADLEILADALERYYLRFGEYPVITGNEATEVLKARRELPGTDPQYYYFSNSLPRTFTAIDPWHESYRYVLHSTVVDVNDSESIETFMLYSLGPDRKEPGTTPDTPDDNIRM